MRHYSKYASFDSVTQGDILKHRRNTYKVVRITRYSNGGYLELKGPEYNSVWSAADFNRRKFLIHSKEV